MAGIRAGVSGETLLAPTIVRRVIEEFVGRPPARAQTPPTELGALTPRELEVLRELARGCTNTEIAGCSSARPP